MRYLLSLSILFALVLIACGDSGPVVDLMAKSQNIDAGQRGFTLQEKIGVDDRAALAFIYGADMMGSLDTCG